MSLHFENIARETEWSTWPYSTRFLIEQLSVSLSKNEAQIDQNLRTIQEQAQAENFQVEN